MENRIFHSSWNIYNAHTRSRSLIHSAMMIMKNSLMINNMCCSVALCHNHSCVENGTKIVDNVECVRYTRELINEKPSRVKWMANNRKTTNFHFRFFFSFFFCSVFCASGKWTKCVHEQQNEATAQNNEFGLVEKWASINVCHYVHMTVNGWRKKKNRQRCARDKQKQT